MLVKIDDIKVRKRVRRDLGNLDALKESIRTLGLLNPITLNSDYELVAGERRLEAAKALGWERISANVLDAGIDRTRQLEIELEENNQRKEFTDDELLEGYERLERMRHPSLVMRILRAIAEFALRIAGAIKALFSRKKSAQKKN